MTDEERYTVTSALPYIHGVPHLGNIVGSVLPADIFHRYLDLRGRENVFICGSDVHGTPLELEAIEQDRDVEELAEENHEKVKEVLESFGMDFSIYSQTHSDYNRKQTHRMFEELYINGFISEEKQRLPYSEEDERFLPDRYIEGECPHCGGLARGDQCDDCGKLVEPEEIIDPYSTISGSEDIEFRDSRHLAIELEEFEDELEQWLDRESCPVPESRKGEVRNLIEEAESRTITRDQDWGFDVPVESVNERIREKDAEVPELDPEVYEEKVLYVWFDAPIGYIGFTRELFEDGEEWREHWRRGDSKTYYSIGKDNTIFHTVIWPAMLLGASENKLKYQLPDYELIQDFLMAEDAQFSKSRGRGLSTEEALDRYPADYWRFYLARNLPQEHDSKFSWHDFESEINNVLNDTVGNFVNRTLSLVEKWFDGKVPAANLQYEDSQKVEQAEEKVAEYVEAFESHDIRGALESAVELARLGDRYLSEEEPWNNEDRREPVIQTCVQIVRGVGALLYPFTPEASRRIEEMLETEIHTEEGYDELQDPLLGGIAAGEGIGEVEVLFEKVDLEDDGEGTNEFDEDTVSFEDFEAMDIRIGEVVSADEHPDADRLYIVKVDVGEAALQTCAGLREHYTAQELEGRRVVVLANLEPATLRGEKSECMMLAAEDLDGNVELLTTEEEMEKGSRVK